MLKNPQSEHVLMEVGQSDSGLAEGQGAFSLPLKERTPLLIQSRSEQHCEVDYI